MIEGKKRKTICVSIDGETIDQLKAAADKYSYSASRMVEVMIKEYLKNDVKKAQRKAA
jgi:metal-responsive CopG/Arc/MetJ family transcriptional regulator